MAYARAVSAMKNFVLVSVTALAMSAIGACGESSTSSASSTLSCDDSDAGSATFGDAGEMVAATEPCEAGAEVEEERVGSVDHSRLGKVCKGLDCPKGESCVYLGGIDPSLTEPRCVVSDGSCGAVTCPPHWNCAQTLGIPAIAFCE